MPEAAGLLALRGLKASSQRTGIGQAEETRPITLPLGTRQLFVCVNNDN
ncbi:hypothetical protein ACFP2F_16925 [Hymenobacter artigasi]|uniref:Uncharacterized protein n=1 Tax=Hymenobacter artigasi TaxID=2719616 RepID=A0ABX1HNZ6_9BACT|nr:hypothetical protein [Hymenobacter artigasi]NKI91936.1 hypothetical protein [Hymenobacter artigasi]